MSWKTVRIKLQPDDSYLLDIDGETCTCCNLETVITYIRRKEEADGQNQRSEIQPGEV